MTNKEVFKSAWPFLWKYRRNMALGMGSLLLTNITKDKQRTPSTCRRQQA